jgi:hypothetical protein
MTWGITAGQAFMGGSALLGGLISSSGAQSAASTQAAAADRAAALQKEMFDEQKRLSEPYRQAGLTGQNRLMELLGIGGNAGAAGYGQYARDFGMQDFQQDPGYRFRLGEGLKAMSRQAGARGGLISGQTMKGLEDYRQASASQEYGNAFNRYQTNRANQLQPLGSLMSSGQAAAAGQAAQAGQYGVNAGNMMGQAGQSIAAGQMGMANTMGNALGSMGSMYQQQQQQNQNQANFNSLFGNRVGGGVGGDVTVFPSYETGMNANYQGFS